MKQEDLITKNGKKHTLKEIQITIMCKNITLDEAPRSKLRPYNDDNKSSQNDVGMQMQKQCRTPITIYPTSVYTGIPMKQLAPCGRCHFCIKNKMDGWFFRLKEEIKYASSAWFCTFTLARENREKTLSHRPTLSKPQWQKFMKRLRYHESRQLVTIYQNGRFVIVRNNRKENPQWKSVKYKMCGEYGKQNDKAPHYHAIIFNASAEMIEKAWSDFTYTKKQVEEHKNDKRFKKNTTVFDWMSNYRKIGHSTIEPVTDARIYYIMKYIDKSKWQKSSGLEMFNFPVKSKYDRTQKQSYKVYDPSLLFVGANGQLQSSKLKQTVKHRTSKQEFDDKKRQAKYNRAKRQGLQQSEFGLQSTGLGKGYLTEAMITWHMADPSNRLYYNTHTKSGKPTKAPLPKYYQNKMFPPFVKYNLQLSNKERIAQKETDIKQLFKEDPTAEYTYNECLKLEAEKLSKWFPEETAF